MNTRTLSITTLALVMLLLSGCQSSMRNIPPGYVGKILTPTGWQTGIQEAGQADIGVVDSDGRGNRLVILEATTKTVKEQFLGEESSPDKTDHRAITKNRTPVDVDIYVNVAIPDDVKTRDSIYARVTPVPKIDGLPEQDRVLVVTIQTVYDQFAKPTIRGKTRDIVARYTDYAEVMKKYQEVNSAVSAMIVETFRENGVPLKLLSGQLSNVKPDKTVWQAENALASANAQVAAIDLIGNAVRSNPGYLQFLKWQTLEKIAGKGVTIIVNEGVSGSSSGATAGAIAGVQATRNQP